MIEESPAPALPAALRRELTAAAAALARTAGYDNVGTVEFLVEDSGTGGRFHFLEMNTRLQVEHPVTELTTGVDLVRGQMEIAARGRLPWTQTGLRQRGHAIECRVYAEDPASGFLPQAGRIELYREPAGPGIRIDSGVEEGSLVPVQYDPLLAKVAACGERRDWALARMVEALRRYPVLGVETNLHLLLQVLRHPRFVSGDLDTGFLDAERDALLAPPGGAALIAALAGAAATRLRGRGDEPAAAASAPARTSDPWTDLPGWRPGGS